MDDWCVGVGVAVGGMALPMVVVLGFAVMVLFDRVRRAEARLVALERGVRVVPVVVPAAETPPPPSEVPTQVEAPPVQAPPKPVPPPRPPAPPRRPLVLPSPERVVVWLGAAFGALALVLAALFSLVAVLENGWIGPAARIALGFAAGTGSWVAGAVQRRRWPYVSSALAGVGIGTLYGTIYAAASVYALIPSGVAFGAMVAVTALATLRATLDRDRFVAWLALIGGVLTPWLVSTGENHPYALFAYLTLLASGVGLSASRRSWPDLVAGAALGVMALHVGWASTWYTASQQPAALLGALVLAIPFAAVAARSDPSVRYVGAFAAALVPLVAVPWMVPVDASFTDPRSMLTTVREEVLAAPLAALAAILVPLPGWLAARRHRSALQAVLTLLPSLALGVVAVVGASVVQALPSPWVAVGAVGPAVVVALVGAGDRATSRGFAPGLAIAGFLLSSAVTQVPDGAFALGLVALAVAAAALVRSTRDGAAMLSAVVAVGLPLWAGSIGVESTLYLAAAAIVVLVLLVQWPLVVRWVDRAEVAWGLAPFAALVTFPALYRSWVDRLGEGGIGLLPLLLAGYVLLAGVALSRRARLTGDSLVVACFALVTLLGITAAVPLQLHDRWLTVAWALEAAALAGISDRVRHPLIRWTSVALCAAVGVRLILNPFALSWGTADEGWVVLNWTLYTWGVPLACVLLVARWLPPSDRVLAALRVPLWVLAALIGFALVNVEVSHAFQPHGVLDLWSTGRVQSMVRSATWAAYGLVVLGIGLWKDQRVVRLVGFAFVLLATIKVFGVDLWDLRGFVRVGSIGCLGVALLLAAVAFERLVLRSTRGSADGGER